MKNFIKNRYYGLGALVTLGFLGGAENARAADFSTIAENIVQSMEDLPGLLSAIAYMMGLLLGVVGVIKIKDHVENPSQTPLKDGAIRLASGGALFALPILFEAMRNTIGDGTAVSVPQLSEIQLGVR